MVTATQQTAQNRRAEAARVLAAAFGFNGRKIMKALLPPDDAIECDDATEVMRGWIVAGDLQVSLAFEAFGNRPEVWGQLLAETVSHLADAMSAERYGDRDAIFAQIQNSLMEHLEKPNPNLTGAVCGPIQ
jgi:hypothetical protein